MLLTEQMPPAFGCLSKGEHMKIIGLCGRSGSGKGYVSKIFREFSGLHIDTDAVYHQLLLPANNSVSPLVGELTEEFGTLVLDGLSLNRKKLGEIVFSSPEKLKKLNEISHRAILAEVRNIIDKSDAPFAIVDAPVLFESGFNNFCDYTVCVVCSDDKSIERIVNRDGITETEAKKRLNSQIKQEELTRKCDFTIYNNDCDDIETQVQTILREIGIN